VSLPQCVVEIFDGFDWALTTASGDGKRFVVRADEKLTAFLELERAICLRLLTDQILEK